MIRLNGRPLPVSWGGLTVKFDLRHLVGGLVAAVVAMAAVAATPALAQNVPVEDLAVQSPIGDIVLGARERAGDDLRIRPR